MIDLSPKTWSSLVAKCKIEDKQAEGLEDALAEYAELEEDAHDECLKTIAKVTLLAKNLKRVKQVAAAAQAAKYLADLIAAAEKEKNDVAKLKAAADKAQGDADKAKATADKAQAEAAKAQAKADKAKAAADKAEGDEDDEEEGKDDKKKGSLKPLLVSMLQKVKSAKSDEPYHYLICDAKPFPYVMIAKQIGAAHRKLLEKESGSKRFLKPGAITFQDGHYCFESAKDIPGQAKKIQGFFKNLTGKKYQIMFGSQKDADDDGSEGVAEYDEETEVASGDAADQGTKQEATGDADSPQGEGAEAGTAEPSLDMTAPFSIGSSVGQGGKNKPQDVQAVQAALNKKMKAGLPVDGKCGTKTIAAIRAFQQTLGKFSPDGLIEPGRGTARALASSAPAGPAPEPPSPVAPPKLGKGTLDKAPDAWRGMRGILEKNIGELKKAVRSEYTHEHPTLMKDIEKNLRKLDAISEKIDDKLANLLAEAHAAKDPADRKAKLQNCKAVVASHIQYVKSEPLIAHMDRNPFGVKTNFQRILTDHLLHVAQAIGK